MQIEVKVRDITIGDDVREKVRRRFAKIGKQLPEATKLSVELREERRGGEPDIYRCDCTLVLKGTIGLSRAQFPQGTLSPMLDALARAPLWAAGCDYGHGTGHGVGLEIHEAPRVGATVDATLAAGQVVTVVDSTGGKGGGTYTIKNGAGKKVTGLRACDLAAHKPLTEVFGQKSSSKS